MAKKYVPYPDYKDSGVEWLGHIPEHWIVCALDKMIDPNRRITYGIVQPGEPDPNGRYMIRGQDYSTGWSAEDSIFKVSDKIEVPYKRARLKTGDIVLTIVGAGVGNTEVVPEWLNGSNITQTTARLAPEGRKASGRFIRYLFSSPAGEANVDRYSKGAAQPGLNLSDVAKYYFCFPSLDEQEKIANFLDHETAKIDTLIEKQQQLIKLLKEKRQAVISHAVTKGLNPNAPMRDSGIEWLGEVPESWEVKLIKHVCQLESGHTPSKSNPAFWIEDDCHIPWVSLNDTKNIDSSDFIYDSVTKISEVGMNNSSAHYIDEGAIVFTRDGARIGLASIMGKSMCVSQHIIAWVCGETVNNIFLLHVIYAMNDELYRIAAGATIPTIGMPDIKKMIMCVPPLDEQLEIVEYLLQKRKQFSHLISNAERAIELMKERRTALISSAVTGKIDVRNWVSPEPSSTANNKEVAA